MTAFPELISLPVAEFGKAFSRRAVRGIGLLAVALLILSAWSNMQLVDQSRVQISQAAAWTARLREEPGLSSEEIARLQDTLDQSKRAHKARIETLEQEFSSERLHAIILSFFGTAPGIALSVLLAATLFGAEFRWGYWKTLISHQPARIKVMLAKFGILWALLLVGLLLLLALSYPLYLLLGRIYALHLTMTWPSLLSLLNALTKAWVTTGCYASIAAAAAVVSRSSLAAAGINAAIVMLDGFLSSRILALRRISASQQVAQLYDDPSRTFGVLARLWFSPVGTGATPTSLNLPLPHEPLLNPISSEAAFLTLATWALGGFAVAAYFIARRDVPT